MHTNTNRLSRTRLLPACLIAAVGLAMTLSEGESRPVAADEKPAADKPAGAELFTKFNRASLVFVAKLEQSNVRAVGLSFPPLYNMLLSVSEVKPLRGKDVPTAWTYSVRQEAEPVLPVGQKVLVSGSIQEGRAVAASVLPWTAELQAAATTAVALPIGWSVIDGKPVSPWRDWKEDAWRPRDSDGDSPICSITKRPALLAGGSLSFQVAKVIPAKVEQFKNPFGNGEFDITVKNVGKEKVTVPALLTDGTHIDWGRSLVILDNTGKPHLLPKLPLKGALKAVELEPGAEVKTRVNTLHWDDISWPRGGSRIAFTFCLGELSQSDFFYYFSALHDKMRAALKKT